MSTAATPTNVPLILKDLWLDGIEDYLYEERPLYAMMGKGTDWVGTKLKITCKYSNGTSVSSKWGTAKKNKRVNRYAQMEVETADLFALWSVEQKLITLSRSEKGALVQYLDEASSDAAEKFRRRTAWQLWGNGGGSAGKVLSISTNQIALENPHGVRNFEIDDPIEFANDDGRAGGGVYDFVLTIADIDEDDGILEFDSNIPADVQVGDFLFHEDDYSNDNHVIKGVFSYLAVEKPGTGSEPTSIWGMDRTVFNTRLAGHRMVPPANLTITEAIKDALTRAYRRNIKTSHIFVSPEAFNEVEMTLDGTVRRGTEKVGKVGFETLEFTKQGGGSIKLVQDADIPLGPNGGELVVGLNLPKWKFHSAEEWGHWQTGTGAKMRVEENANSLEGRLGGYGNPYCKAPGQQWVEELGN